MAVIPCSMPARFATSIAVICPHLSGASFGNAGGGLRSRPILGSSVGPWLIGRTGEHDTDAESHVMTDQPIALDAYEDLAESYAALVDTKPHNAYYERPATLSLLPDVEGKKVLDVGCGPGAYAERLLDRGAQVVAVDVSPRMAELAKARTRGRAEVHRADIAAPLSFLETASFDLVLGPLVMDYVRNWRATFGEFHRLLHPGGHLVVSVTHPFFDFTYFKSERYFETELVASEWKGFGPKRVRVPSYRRSLEDTVNPFLESGFQIERLLEPKPTKELCDADPRHFEELGRQPCFLCIRAVKP